MKKYLKDIIILLVQSFMFYIFPLFVGPTDVFGMVFLIIIVTFMLAIIFGVISNYKLKIFYPLIVSIAFIPSIFLYYNESALIHTLWYFVISIIGLLVGIIFNLIIKKENKIDLHIHTLCSDGTDSVLEILKKANDLKLEVISITDHNSCKAYDELRKKEIKKIYQGNIITGCEFTTNYDNRLIEVLGYGFDIKIINLFLGKYYTRESADIRNNTLYDELLKKVDSLGLKYNLNNINKNQLQDKSYDRIFFNELCKYPENKEILKEDVWSSNSSFFRRGLCNPESVLYINPGSYYPSIKRVIDMIHKAGGKAFLAHPYIYDFDDLNIFLDKLYNDIRLDGIEVFYVTFNSKQVNYLTKFAKRRDLLMSCGSDYHGSRRPEITLGLESKSFDVPENILDNWGIDLFH